MATRQCAGCPQSGKQPKPTPEQMKAIMEMQNQNQERKKAIMKDIKSLNDKSLKLIKAMFKCKKCKEYKYKFVPCEEHFEKMKAVTEEIQKVQTYYKLKGQLGQFK